MYFNPQTPLLNCSTPCYSLDTKHQLWNKHKFSKRKSSDERLLLIEQLPSLRSSFRLLVLLPRMQSLKPSRLDFFVLLVSPEWKWMEMNHLKLPSPSQYRGDCVSNSNCPFVALQQIESGSAGLEKRSQIRRGTHRGHTMNGCTAPLPAIQSFYSVNWSDRQCQSGPSEKKKLSREDRN